MNHPRDRGGDVRVYRWNGRYWTMYNTGGQFVWVTYQGGWRTRNWKPYTRGRRFYDIGQAINYIKRNSRRRRRYR